ncbi:MAG: S1-C subfamily serine protease [Planctomycetota bacterium]|jgi:S1-C subfamily serine protease
MTEQHETHIQPKRSFLRTILPYCNLIVAAGLTFSLAGVTNRIGSTENDNEVIEATLTDARNELHRLQSECNEQIDVLSAKGEQTAGQYRHKIDSYNVVLDALESRLAQMESSSQNTTSKTDERVSAFRGELDELRTRIRETPAPKKTAAEIFRTFEKEHRDGVVLIYTEFDYRRTGTPKKPLKTVTGWGSGFFISKDGYIATNKHVVQPWKFDTDLAAMTALGEIEIIEDSIRIACWQSGCKAFDDAGEPRTSVGFNTWKLKNLKLAVQAKDSMKERELEYGGFGPTLKIHALDNNDVVLLKAEGKNFDPLPLHQGSNTGLEKLDQVMALGFPRGRNGLESGKVESSPSIGTVRKVENTIHVTASIIPGNSGGPLIGPEGNVVGIVTRVYSETLGICLQIDHIQKLVDQLAAKQKAVDLVVTKTGM